MTNSILKSQKRDVQIDVAKGIAVILVIAGHLFTYGSIPFKFIFSFHMPLFFMISGMFRHKEEICLNRQLKNRVLGNLLIPYSFFVGLALIIQMSLLLFDVGVNWNEIKRQWLVWGPYPFGAVWFLVMLSICNVLSVLLNRVNRYRLLAFLLLSSYILSKIPVSNLLLFKTIPTALLFYHFGGILMERLRDVKGGGVRRAL